MLEGNREPSFTAGGTETDVATIEIGMENSQKAKIYHMTQLCHSLAYVQRSLCLTPQILAQPWSLLLHSQ